MSDSVKKKASRSSKTSHMSIGSVKSSYGGSGTLHSGQPQSLPGKGLKTGHKGNNTKQ